MREAPCAFPAFCALSAAAFSAASLCCLVLLLRGSPAAFCRRQTFFFPARERHGAFAAGARGLRLIIHSGSKKAGNAQVQKALAGGSKNTEQTGNSDNMRESGIFLSCRINPSHSISMHSIAGAYRSHSAAAGRPPSVRLPRRQNGASRRAAGSTAPRRVFRQNAAFS